jgi:hypothetical protein
MISSCTKDWFTDIVYEGSNDASFYTYPENIDTKTIHPTSLQYYKNLSELALWYANHPFFRSIQSPVTAGKTENNLLQKFESMIIFDSTGNRISFFDLPKDEMSRFLGNWRDVEAFELSHKAQKDADKISLALIAERNSAFQTAWTNLKSGSTIEDPYYTILNLLDEREKNKIKARKPLPALKSDDYNDDTFWASVVANGLMSFSIIQPLPIERAPQTFVDNLRPNIKKGRVLIALPGGWTTTSLLVLYPNKNWYDVGHVAVIIKEGEQLSDSIDTTFNFTIGTGTSGTHYEEVGSKWCKKHGLAFLGQICTISWEMYKSSPEKRWKWRKVINEIDGEKLVEKVTTYVEVPYCSTLDVFFAKWAAPESFICSSLAWYCVRETQGINLSDWWSTSVYPVDLFFSEHIRIIDDTLD